MPNKEIYAAIELADYEVRLVVGEFYENHLNILRVERVRHNGIQQQVIVNEGSIINAIMSACEKTSNILGYKIERVLLVMPSANVTHQNGRVNVKTRYGKIQLADIQRGMNEVIMSEHDEDLELVNVGGIKYIVNGIGSRKIPFNEECDHFSIELDLFYADKNILYSYAKCVEKANLEIQDISLDAYAIGEEAALFEKAISNYIVLVNLGRQTTTLSLFSQGKLVNSEVMPNGYGDWVSRLQEALGIKTEVAVRLLSENPCFEEKEYSDAPVFIWAEKNEERTISLRQLHEITYQSAKDWAQRIHDAYAVIQQNGPCKVVVSGDGSEFLGVESLLPIIGEDVTLYTPQTIGGRSSSLVAVLGMFYAWRDINKIRNSSSICTEQRFIEESIKGTRKNSEEQGFTKKLMNIIMNEK